MAVALALSVMMVLWSTLPVQAQSESADPDTGDAQPAGQHLITFNGNKLPKDYAERIAALGGTVEANYPEIGVAVVSGLTEDAAESLRSSEGVQEVEQDVERQWLDPGVNAPSEEVVAADAMAAEVAPAGPNNPAQAQGYPRQKWNLQAINADRAWQAQPKRLGSNEVTVAILDTGIDATEQHVDLQGRIDQARSTSFVPSDNQYRDRFSPRPRPWTDFHYHGTHVASTVSSNANLGAGVTSKVKLMAVKVLGVNGRGTDSAMLAGIMHAANNGADVINMSLDGPFIKTEQPGFVSVINRAINHANRMGSVIVVAAGNERSDMDADSNLYQAYCQSPHVVCVSATGPTSQKGVNGPWTEIDAHAPYSNFGSPVTVAAPGGNGTTSVWAACPRTSLQITSCQTGSTLIGLKGTSMAPRM
jgi:subtilisin family serine protease